MSRDANFDEPKIKGRSRIIAADELTQKLYSFSLWQPEESSCDDSNDAEKVIVFNTNVAPYGPNV